MYDRLASKFYLTPLCFLIAAIRLMNQHKKREVDLFHLRQSLGLYLTLVFFLFLFKLFDTGLYYGEPASLIVWIYLIAMWALGLRAALAEKETALPLIGMFYQRCLSFIRE